MLLREIRNNYKRPVSRDTEYGVDRGRYIGMHFTPETKEHLKRIVHDEALPHPVPDEKLHSTITYSKDNPVADYKVAGKLDDPVEGEIDSFDIFPSQEGNNCLVAKLKCPEFQRRHQMAREMGASYDYDEYIPHITLSYNAGEVSPEKLDSLTQKYKGTRIYADEEYDEPLKDNWAKDL